MKTLVAFYSRTGTTKKVAEKIAEILVCNLEEIFDIKDRSGAYGYLTAGRDATLRKLTTLQPLENNPADYELVIIGTPIWSWNVSTPIRTYLENNKSKFRQVAFFCTMGGSGGQRAFSEMEKIINIKPVATLELQTKEVVKNEYEKKLKEFIEKLS